MRAQRTISDRGLPGGVSANNDWSVSVVAFGHPSSVRIFSGYSKSLTAALRNSEHLREEFSYKLLRPVDALRGAMRLGFARNELRMVVRSAWYWSEAASAVLSKRVCEHIDRSGDRGAFLEIGTYLRLDAQLGSHFMLTDLTIPQARRAGFFSVARLSRRRLDEAEALQVKSLAGTAHVFALSQWTADSLIHDCGIPSSRVTVVYAGSNLGIPEGLSETRDGMEILFVGVDWERKGGPLLLEAFRILKTRLPHARLSIVGCDPGISEPGVVVEGFLNKEDPEQFERLARCYLRASCFCLPSLFDPFPNAIIEAASVGLPVVAIDNGSRREVVVPSETGFLAARADARSLADALLMVLSEPQQYKRLGEAAQAHAAARFTWREVIRRIGAAVCSVHRTSRSHSGVFGGRTDKRSTPND